MSSELLKTLVQIDDGFKAIVKRYVKPSQCLKLKEMVVMVLFWELLGSWMDRVGLLREMCKAKSQRYLLLSNQWKHRHITSMLAVRAAFSCFSSSRIYLGIYISNVWSHLVDDIHQNLSMINFIFWRAS